MKTEQDLRKLAEEYKEIKTPDTLQNDARRILGRKNKRLRFFLRTGGLTAACLAAAFITAVNTSPSFAENLKGIPFLNSAARLVTFRAYEQTGEHSDLSIDQPEIKGLTNEELGQALNHKYAAEATSLYKEYTDKIDGGIENITLQSGYSVKADNGTTVSIEHSIFTAEASGVQRYEYDTLDTERELYITLPSLFQDETYINQISKYIRQQMEQQMTTDSDRQFFLDESGFRTINPNQQFYINNDKQLVIVFDEYEVAPGFMGTQEFTIPTEVIADLLVSNTYIN